MKIFGSIQKLVSLVFQVGARTVTVSPASQTASKTLTIPDLVNDDTLVTNNVGAVLTNKSLDATNMVGDLIMTDNKVIAFRELASNGSARITLKAPEDLLDTNYNQTLPSASGEITVNTATQELTNKKLTGGTASTSNQWTIPNKSDTTSLTTNVAGNVMYDTTAKKLKVSDGSGTAAAWKVVGGGLIPVAIDKDYATTLESGKHYLYNGASASGDVTLTLPAGTTEADIKVTVYNIPSGKKVIIAPNGAEKIFYNDTDNATVEFRYAETEQWAEFIWNGTKWLVNDNSNVLSGTFSGSLDFTGGISFNGGDQLSYYDEGTWTQTIGSTSGTLGGASYGTAYYTRIGRMVEVTFDSTITNNGTGSGRIEIAGLPFACTVGGAGIGREISATGNSFVVTASGSSLFLDKHDNTYVGGTGYRLIGTFSYFV